MQCNFTQTNPRFYFSPVEAFRKTLGEKEIVLLASVSPLYFLSVWRTFHDFYEIWNCFLPFLSVWKSPKFVVWERDAGL